MKIIDLLNKIANDEEVPKKIKYEKYIYEYEEGTYDWSYYIKNNGTIKFLLTDVFNSNDNILNILNNEVEIIKENKIPEKIEIYKDGEGHYFIDKHCKKIYITCDEVNFMVEEFNQLIDYLKNKGDE